MTFESFSSDSIRPEYFLLFWCIRKCPETEKTEQIRTLIRNGIDWSFLIEAAVRHGLVPALYKQFESNQMDEVPQDALIRLRDDFRKNALWNLGRTRELFKLLDLFAAKGIRAIPYKGPILAQQVYGDLSLRQFDDLDIFVHKEDVLRTKKVLLTEGYRPEFDLTARQEQAYLKSNCEYNFHFGCRGIHVEVHWDFVPHYFSIGFDMEDLWKSLQPISLYGREIFLFSKEDLFLILCVHCGYKHFWERLSWIADAAHLMESFREDSWEIILRKSSEMKIDRIVLLGLLLARDVAGVRVPESVFLEINVDPAAGGLADRVRERLYSDDQNSRGFWQEHLFRLRMRGQLRDQVRYCFDLGLTQNIGDWQPVSLPDSLYPLYRLIRPLRLGLKYGPSLFRRVFSRSQNFN
jgi:hypothetical protein